MSVPRFDKPVYFLRSRGGEVLGPFTRQEVSAQLDARKIDNDGEIRRQGWEVLEKEELWGKIKDFPVFGYAGPTGRHEVYALKAKAKTLWATGIALLVITLAAFIGMFFMPFREAELKMDAAKEIAANAKAESLDFRKRLDQEVAAAKKQWTAEFEANLKSWESDKSKAVAELLKTRKALADAEGKLGSERSKIVDLTSALNATKEAKSAAEERAQAAIASARQAEAAATKRAAELAASFDERVTQAEARLRAEVDGLVARYSKSAKSDFMRPLSNPRMARVLPQTNQGQGKLVLLVSERLPAGTKLDLFDGLKTLHVTVSKQVLGPPMMLVDVDAGQAGEVSAAAFLDSEVVVSRTN
jgi:hypothetical protein